MDDPMLDAYDRLRVRISDLVREPGADPSRPVPTCPDWTVTDVVAHLVGLAEDVGCGNTDQYGQPGWTAEQVRRLAGVGLDELLERWAAAMPQLREAPAPSVARPFGGLGRLVFMDAAVHEHDLRGVLDRPQRDNDAAVLGIDISISILGKVLRRDQEAGTVAPLRIIATGESSWRLGEGSDPVTVEGTLFELWRGLSGRRSRDQVAALRWSGDAAPFLDRWTFGPLPFSAQPIAY